MEFFLAKAGLPVSPNELMAAVEQSATDIDIKGERDGFIVQTVAGIIRACTKDEGDFWALMEGDDLLGYVLGRLTVEVDNKLTYWLAQAWVDKRARGKKGVKAAWQQIRAYAKARGCKHIVVVSSRGTDAYCRFLGRGWHEYARLLKEDI